ncbi:unnamed protein product [Rotaria sordida]|uniref:F-box domain-containing protein n=2 Tax=Rotaria sordida TaxID=392033 RepID=A0A819NTM7_9BILA|nr:unnamed protein product [Rotaria sordida]CAF4001727.1 unnamed protein product [Rotaria sordida]
MDICTCLEDLSNEIFFEIFDYLHALDIFTAFASLNKRIQSILQSIRLHVNILNSHYDREINFLSSLLTFHAHQVISLKCYDTIRDHSSIISLLFNRHHFINLQSCIFILDNSSTELENVIKQVESLNRLVAFFIIQPHDKKINEKDKCDITRTILMNKSSSLRSIKLHYDYDYLDISTYTSNASNIKSLELLISGSSNKVSIYSILPILRVCHRIRYLHAIIKHEILSENNYLNFSIPEAFINENDLPISPQLTCFDLSIFGQSYIDSIAYILRCMPNLVHFKFLHEAGKIRSLSAEHFLNGYKWQHMFEMHVPFLSKFDFHISIVRYYPKLNLDRVVNSFEYFVKKYPEWQMIIDRWLLDERNLFEIAILRTFAYHKYERNLQINIPIIYYGSFDTRSTKATTNDHYLYYSDIKDLKLKMMNIEPIITSFPLFQHINSLVIVLPKMFPRLSNNGLNIVNYVQSIDNGRSQERVTYLSRFVHLANVNEINFQSDGDISRWKDIQFILQACSNVINLKINPSHLVLPEFIDSPSLLSIFKQIKILKSITENHYVPLSFSLKLVERFPSLTDIELKVFSFDDCISAIDILLTHLKNLSYLKIYYIQVSSLDHPFSRNYIIEKRRQAFRFNIIDEHKVTVSKNTESVEIGLS